MTQEPEQAENSTIVNKTLSNATAEFEKMNYTAALAELEQIPPFARTPSVLSAYALCLAEVKGSYKTAAGLCHEAIKKEPKNPEHYYRQGRILLLAGRKKDAIWVLRMGMRHGKHQGIIDCLGSLGVRRAPPIGFLERSNPINKLIGRLLTKLNLR